MKITTYEDCIETAKKTGLPPHAVAKAFGIDLPEENKNIKKEIREIIENKGYMSFKRLWQAYNMTHNGTKTERDVLEALISVATAREDVEQLKAVIDTARANILSDIKTKAMENAVDILTKQGRVEDLRHLYESENVKGTPIGTKIVKAIVELTE